MRWDALGSHQALKTRFRPVRRKELKDSFHSLSETVYKEAASGPRDKKQYRDEGERAMGEEGATCRGKDTVLGETAFSPQAPAAGSLSAISRGFQGSDSNKEARASLAYF